MAGTQRMAASGRGAEAWWSLVGARGGRPALVLGLCLLATSPAGAQRAATWRDDPRLATRVTVRMGKTPLAEVLGTVGRQVGVELAAAPDVADEPAIVFAREQPAHEVLRQLALLFDYRWRRSGGPGHSRYELYQDDRGRQSEEARRSADRRQLLERLQRALRQRLALAAQPAAELRAAADAYEGLGRGPGTGPPPGTPRPGTVDPLPLMRRTGSGWPVREMTGGHWPAMARVAASLTAGQWAALGAGRTLRFSTRREPGFVLLSSQLARELRAATPAVFPPGYRPNYIQPGGPAATARREQRLRAQWRQAEAFHLRALIEPRSGYGLPQATLRLGLTPVLPADAGGERVQPSALALSTTEAAPAAGAAAEPSFAADDPVLGLKRALRLQLPAVPPEAGTVERLNQLLTVVGEAYPVNLVADAYRHPPLPWPALPGGETMALAEVLDRYVRPAAGWRRDGDFLRVRRRTWYQDRLAEIPERVARQWAERLRERPRLATDELASLVLALRDEQLTNFEPVLRERGIDLGGTFDATLEPNRDFLRAYGSLPVEQRQRLREEKQLAYAEMAPAARRWLEVALDQRSRGEELPPPAVAAAPALLDTRAVLRTLRAAGDRVAVDYRVPGAIGLPTGAIGLGTVATHFVSATGPLPPNGEVVPELYFRYDHGGRTESFLVIPPAVTVRPKAAGAPPRRE
jgi:hypothetical protein